MLPSWSRAVENYLGWIRRNAPWVCLLWAGLSVAGGWLAPRIVVEPNLESLLPAGAPALAAADELRARVPSSSPHYLLVTSDDPALNRRLAGQLVAEVEKWPETRSAMARRDPDYFLQRKLLFLPEERLEELAEQAEQFVDYRRCAKLPGCFNLEDEPDLPSEAELAKELGEVPEVAALLSVLGMDAIPSPSPAASAATAGQGQPSAAIQPGDLCSSDGEVCTVQVILDQKPSNLPFAAEMLDRSEQLFRRLTPPDAPASLRMETSGPYRNIVHTQQAVKRDLGWTAFVSVALMALVLCAQFRGLRAFALLLLPLVASTLTTIGLVALTHPRINLISAFTLAILAGLGIDFGVHLLTHYGEGRRAGREPTAALAATFEALRGPMAVAAVTTTSGFGALAVGSFRGFAEMGVLAALGIAVAFLAYFSLFPALVKAFGRAEAQGGEMVRTWPLQRIRFKEPRQLSRRIVVAGVGLAALGAWVGSGLSFEYDFRNLRPEGVSHGIHWSRTMHGTARPSVVLLADSQQELQRVASELREHPDPRLRHESSGPAIVTPSSFLPENQPRRLAALAEIRRALERGLKGATGEDRQRLERFLPYVSYTEPITPSSLPAWVTGWLGERDGSFGKYGLAYTGLRGSDGHEMETLASVLSEWSQQYPEVTFASGAALIGIVVPGLRSDAPTMIGLALAGLCLGALAIGRSGRRLFIIVAPLALAMALALGVAVAAGMKINLYNLVVFPLAFGIGVDGAVYVSWSLDPPGGGRSEDFSVAARGVCGSTLTTTAGFASLMIASNPGLSSLGSLATVTFLATLLANLVWLPALVLLLRKPVAGFPEGAEKS